MDPVGTQFFIEQVEPGQTAISGVGSLPGIDAVEADGREGGFFGCKGYGYGTFGIPKYLIVGYPEGPGFPNRGFLVAVVNLPDDDLIFSGFYNGLIIRIKRRNYSDGCSYFRGHPIGGPDHILTVDHQLCNGALVVVVQGKGEVRIAKGDDLVGFGVGDVDLGMGREEGEEEGGKGKEVFHNERY